ncbi:hypothetical protein AQUCO_01100523v1 [Aquilegia coerulea]|uniref:Uncharacterized protein n=1 Tax=Aquilegia coerulea TaxID=218851 RepID=A0A2G5E7I3_AQUCA|nr:hypothetical protein AQUCO_01100523v1 [Aquilegia coerulea]
MVQNQNSAAIVVDLLLRTKGETLWIFAHLDRVLIFKSIPGATRFPSLMMKFFKRKDKPTLLRFSPDYTYGDLLGTLKQYNFDFEDNMLYFNRSELLLVLGKYISLDRAIQAFWGISVNGGIEIHDWEWLNFDIEEIDLKKIGVAAVNGYFLGQMFRCIAEELINDS